MPDLSCIEERCRALATPADYYAGISAPPELLPRSVLLFHRNRPMSRQATVHHRFVLALCFRAEGAVVVDGRLSAVGPGQGLLIFPHQSHYFTGLEGKPVSWLFITFELDNADPLLSLRDTPFTMPGDAWPRVDDLLAAFTAASRERADTAYWLSLLLTRLVRRQEDYVGRRGGRVRADDPHWALLRRVTQCVHRRIGEGLRVEDVAGEVALSASHLRTVFRRSMGISLGAFITATAIHKACGLLHSSDLNVTEIAETCGFSSVYSFSRAFRREMGLSATAYRNRVRR